MTQNISIHIKERQDSKPDERYFDGWVHPWGNVVSQREVFAKGSSAMIQWITKTTSEILLHGRQTGQDVCVSRVHENF